MYIKLNRSNSIIYYVLLLQRGFQKVCYETQGLTLLAVILLWPGLQYSTVNVMDSRLFCAHRETSNKTQIYKMKNRCR